MTALAIDLPDESGRTETHALKAAPVEAPGGPLRFNRRAFAAVHVVADPFAAQEPSLGPAIDWDATLAFRRHVLDLGLGVADAMDTAQRGMGLDWPAARALIERSLAAAAPEERERIVSGVGTDQLDPAEARSLDDIVAAYHEQLAAVQKAGGRVVLMASRALARIAACPADYETVYARVLAEADAPVILHWLGEMFDPALAGYWGAADFPPALETALAVIDANAAKVDGIKLSLLDDGKEVAMRRRLPDGVRMYTGDDFNYPALIEGDAEGRSDALLGIFDPIAPAASAALAALAAGDAAAYRRLLGPTVPLSRLIFRAPTQHYKTGVVFLAYLNAHQDHFVMMGGAQAMRPLPYFTALFRLADGAGLLRDPERAVSRMRRFLRLYGIEG
ncbi:MAG: dihydrodipicolinate synthase family protein [Rhodospirillales bacterium]|nr:dihydrodipicolinate synthase family protein [Rhodospirillales bacterium]MDE0380388.1 dihydrodipicolinate synthase family protein [Rhodospirillales bacterium]